MTFHGFGIAVCGYHDGCPPDGPVCHLCEHLQPQPASQAPSTQEKSPAFDIGAYIDDNTEDL
jgi:hypothetical protein